MIQFLLSASELGIAMGAMIALYFIMMFQSARLTHDKYIESIRTHIQNRQQLQSLKESDARYKTLLDSATDAFFLHDLDGNILDVNRQACQSLGYSRNELLRMTPHDLTLKQDANLIQSACDRLLRGERFVQMEKKFFLSFFINLLSERTAR